MAVILPAFLLLVGFAMEAATSHYQSSGWFEGLPCQDSGLSVSELYLDCSSLGNCSTVECLLHDFIDDYESGTGSGSGGVVGTASFYVHNCSVDPVVVDVSVSVPQLGIEDFHHKFTESGIVYSDPSNSNGPVMVEMSRNATHLQLVVESFYNEEAVYLIPLVHVPLNASQCMCESLKNLSQYACTENSACDGVHCNFEGLSYTVDLLVLSCDDPPGIGITILNPDGTDFYMGTFDETQSIPIPPVGSLKVSILHHEYSMDVEISIVSFTSVNILPRQTIILDKSNCSVQPSTPPPPTEVPAETCAAIENITSTSTFCKANPGCSSVECTVPVAGHHIEMGVLPCNTPPALHVTVQDPDGLVLYDNILTESAMIPIQANGFTFFNLDVTILQSETMDSVTVKVDVVLPTGGRRNILPETTIPINRTACPVALPTQTPTEPGTDHPTTDSRCQTMEDIAAGLEEVQNMPCSRSDSPCYDVQCVSVNETERSLKMTILNCDNPPSVRLVVKDKDKNVNFNHTFENSEIVPLVPVGGDAVQLNVTVDHVDDKTIGLQIVLLIFGSPTVLVPYTLIPLDDSGCVSTSSTSSNKPVVAIVVPVGVVLCFLVAALLVVVVFLVCRRHRRKRLFEPVRLTDVDQEEDED